MTIGIPVEIDINSIVSKNIDGTEFYDYTVKQNFKKGKRFQQGEDIYEYINEDVGILDFDAATTYTGGELVYGDPYGAGNGVYEVVVPEMKYGQKWSWDYDDGYDTGVSFNAWTKRNVRLCDEVVGTTTLTFNDVRMVFIDKFNGYFDIDIYKDGVLYISTTVRNITSGLDYGYDDPAVLMSVTDADVNDFFIPQAVVNTPLGLFIRTHLEKPAEWKLLGEVIYTSKKYLSFFNGFVRVEKVNVYKPFDGKNYTIAKSAGSVRYTFKPRARFNSIVLANVVAAEILITVKDETNVIKEELHRTLDLKMDADGVLGDYPTTVIFYAQDGMYESTDTVTIRLLGSSIEVGTIMLTRAVDAGFTNLSLSNSYKDFSVFEYDPWGNIDYTERAKVSTYTATVDVPIKNYDMTDRLMKSIGKNVVAIDGADLTDESVETEDRMFTSTQKIGRILSYRQNTVIDNTVLSKMAQYTLTIEEIV